jgi:predicted DNA-binding transcriptional regulator AlpA
MATMPRQTDGSTERQILHELSSEQLLITARRSAAICGKSLRTWRTWDAAGWIPRPVRIGRSTLWRADELRNWVNAGCPRRAEWEAQQ